MEAWYLQKKGTLYEETWKLIDRSDIQSHPDFRRNIDEAVEHYAITESPETFKVWLNQLLLEGYRPTDVFLRYWDTERLRSIMVDSIRIDHLTDNPKLLLKWWEEVHLTKGPEDELNKFEQFISLTMKKYESPTGEINNDFFSDPFMETLRQLAHNSNDFYEAFEQALRKIVPQK